MREANDTFVPYVGKEATSRFVLLTLRFSNKAFSICLDLSHPNPSSHLSSLSSSLRCYSIQAKLNFQFSFFRKIIPHDVVNDLINSD